MTLGLGRTLEASLPEGFSPCWNSCQDWYCWRDKVALEPKSKQGLFAMVQMSLAGWVPSWKSFRRGPKNSGGVEHTNEYHARLAEASTK